MENSDLKPDNEVDLYRDTPVRYLGYANEVGEAFRAQIGSKWVAATYGLATCYVLADTFDKSRKVYHSYNQKDGQIKQTAFTAADTVTWQMLASVIIPGFTINRVCAGSNYLLKNYYKNLPKSPRRLAVTSIGLLTIPFIIKPIDHFVDALMDNTFRKIKLE